MANSPIVSSLPDYVEQNRDLITSTSILGGKSTQLFTKQSGVKGQAAINLLSTSVSFGDGSTCGWNEAGTSTLTQRVITTGAIKVNMAYCWKALIGKWTEHQIEIKADPNKLPFEQLFFNGIIDQVQEELEKAIWQGDTTSETVNLSRFDGMLKILGADGSGVIPVTITAGATHIAAVKETLKAIPARCLKEDTVIFCSPEFLRDYEQELVSANLYHFIPNKDFEDITIPGSNVKLVAVGGLVSQSKLVGARLSNLFYGYDIDGGERVLHSWWNEDLEEYRVRMLFNAGVQVAFPNEIVLATFTTLS